MAEIDKDEGVKKGLSRRDFLKATAATAAVGAAGVEFAAAPSMAAADTVAATYHTTCPYCSASCGQLVDVDASGDNGTVLDVYGDNMSPYNAGGLCAKGAGAYQLVTNKRRIGAFGGTHPVNPVFAATDASGGNIAYKRTANGPWSRMELQAALNEAAGLLKTARDSHTGAMTDASGYNSKGVAFFGSSHMNNEQCYMYRKIIANFGTTDTEHQARI